VGAGRASIAGSPEAGCQRPPQEHLSWLGPGSVATGQPGSEAQPAAALGEALERRRGTGVRVSPPPPQGQVIDLAFLVTGRCRLGRWVALGSRLPQPGRRPGGRRGRPARALADEQRRGAVPEVMGPQGPGRPAWRAAGLSWPCRNLRSRSGPLMGAVNTRPSRYWQPPVGHEAIQRPASRWTVGCQVGDAVPGPLHNRDAVHVTQSWRSFRHRASL
jgi:hypothetical protein